ncbi:MAG TPA: LytTR family DNA-binding domain-containing protein [Bacteroidia bacterium]|nr:LytTR family DNA-binding domain-containing protein [Bacteroidia bacterium]
MKCIVIDDEPLARKGMQMLIDQTPVLKLTAMFSNAVDADTFLKSNQVDLVFLDIQMPKLNGMEYLRSCSPNFKVIITTAYPQFAVDAFELNVVDYLLKPIRFERFYKAISRISDDKQGKTKKIIQEEDYIFIRSERKYIRSNFNEIDYVEGLKDYVVIHCGSEKHIVASNLKTIHKNLPANLFIRINKSYIVNVTKVKSIDHEFAAIGIKKLPIGVNFKKAVLDFIELKRLVKK